MAVLYCKPNGKMEQWNVGIMGIKSGKISINPSFQLEQSPRLVTKQLGYLKNQILSFKSEI